ncbi:tellurite resistance protein [Lampropedia hyalina DSM 16112]|jgi:tellurite resistance protein|uniref:Tellurite resistance protein n=1 Tax=Lampropedia hyalina DSM 16112 TaxID=1122156 RepID=A0A1M5EB13_9BURK|nr:SLAC1 anion channel family protein [Lampropedia hyalina]SHF76261.1 tellurite resistance protein [Lampropedia hyalina DSM 16112]
MHHTSTALPESHSRLQHLPIALFATVMGLAGLSIAWMKAQHAAAAPAVVADSLRWIASLIWLTLLLAYTAKWLKYPDAVRAERQHPVKLNFLAAITIGLLLLSVAWTPSAPSLARWLWTAGACAHLLITLVTMGTWLYRSQFTLQQVTAAWFIPVVGNIIVPIAGMRYAPPDVSWFFFSIGLVFWLVLMTIVLYRLFFHDPLPAKLNPTLFILIAPPAVGFLAWLTLHDGQVDALARILYSTALFIALLLSTQARLFLRTPFFLSAWAYSFPLAALTIATLEMHLRTQTTFYLYLGLALLTVTTAVIGILVAKTLQAFAKGRIFLPD